MKTEGCLGRCQGMTEKVTVALGISAIKSGLLNNYDEGELNFRLNRQKVQKVSKLNLKKIEET